MKKWPTNKFFSLAMSGLLFIIVVGNTQALTIELTEQGTLNFYQGSVLGKTDNLGKTAVLKTAPVTNSGQAKKTVDTQDDVLVKQIGKYQQKEIELASQKSNGKIKVTVQDVQTEDEVDPSVFVETEETEATTVKVKLPKIEEISIKSLEQTETTNEEEVEVEIGTQDDELTIKSNGVTAKTSANFTLSPDGMVTLTTPSGNTHQLKHYPQQAIAVMLAKGKMTMEMVQDQERERERIGTPSAEQNGTPSAVQDGSASAGSTDQPDRAQVTSLDIAEGDDGNLYYTANVKSKKKFLGLIPWEVNQEYQLNDQTGTVDVQLAESETILSRLMNLVSTE